MRPGRRLRRGLLGLGAVAVLIQLLPFGREHANPPVGEIAPFPDATTRTLVTRSCFDCHSNQTRWAWYTFVAPVSWAVQRDVYRARERLNFTEWEESQQIEKAPQKVRSGEMPLVQYLLVHPEARLSAAERETLARGLEALAETEGGDGEGEDGRGRDGGSGRSGGEDGSGRGRSGRE